MNKTYCVVFNALLLGFVAMANVQAASIRQVEKYELQGEDGFSLVYVVDAESQADPVEVVARVKSLCPEFPKGEFKVLIFARADDADKQIKRPFSGLNTAEITSTGRLILNPYSPQMIKKLEIGGGLCQSN